MYVTGDVEIWLHPEVARNGNEVNFPNGLRLCRLPNRCRDAERSCIIYGIPIRSDLVNFRDHIGDVLLRYNRRGTTEPTETVEAVFDSIDPVGGHYYNRSNIYCCNSHFRCAPKGAHICRVCKSVYPKHRPEHCTEIHRGVLDHTPPEPSSW